MGQYKPMNTCLAVVRQKSFVFGDIYYVLALCGRKQNDTNYAGNGGEKML